MRRRAVLIVNPASDGGRTGGVVPALVHEAGTRGIEAVVRRTEGPGHATELAREAAADGEPLLVSVGGDGTLNEIVNGLPLDDDAPLLGVVERGTGADFVRTHGIPKDAARAVALLAQGRERRVDLGQATFAGPAGTTTRRFANHASCGLTGDVARRANAGDKRLPGTVAFMIATVRAFWAWRNVELTVTIDGVRRDLVGNSVVCGVGRYFGGGIKIAPHAEPDDGLLETVVIGDVGRADLVRNAHRLYLGTIERHPLVDAGRGRSVRVESATALPIELDGEQPGTTPVEFSILAGAVRLVVP